MGLSTALVVGLGATAGIAGSTLMSGGGGSAPSAPSAPQPPAPMPVPDDAAAAAAKRRKIASIESRSGRLSTILSDAGNSAGGASDKLGG